MPLVLPAIRGHELKITGRGYRDISHFRFKCIYGVP